MFQFLFSIFNFGARAVECRPTDYPPYEEPQPHFECGNATCESQHLTESTADTLDREIARALGEDISFEALGALPADVGLKRADVLCDVARSIHDEECDQFRANARIGGWVARASEHDLPVFSTIQSADAYWGR